MAFRIASVIWNSPQCAPALKRELGGTHACSVYNVKSS